MVQKEAIEKRKTQCHSFLDLKEYSASAIHALIYRSRKTLADFQTVIYFVVRRANGGFFSRGEN